MSRNASHASAPLRREEHAEDTRRSLLAAARHAFARKGYADTSLEDIVGPARLTKGALYHHFKNKAAVFEALYVAMDQELIVQLTRAVETAGSDPWAQTVAALDAFFAASAEPEYVRIVLRDGPHVLGPRHEREIDHSIGLGFVSEMLTALRDRGMFPATLPITATARVLVAMTGEVAISMAYSDDPALTRKEGMQVVLAMLEGLKVQAQGEKRRR